MSTSTLRPDFQAEFSHLAGNELVTVVTVDRETPWKPESPLEVPRNPRQAGGMPVRRMPLEEMIKHNKEAIRTCGRFWYVAAELLGDDHTPGPNAANGGEVRTAGTGEGLGQASKQLAPERPAMTAGPDRESDAAAQPGRIDQNDGSRASQSSPMSAAPAENADAAGVRADRGGVVPQFRVIDQAGNELPASITVVVDIPERSRKGGEA